MEGKGIQSMLVSTLLITLAVAGGVALGNHLDRMLAHNVTKQKALPEAEKAGG